MSHAQKFGIGKRVMECNPVSASICIVCYPYLCVLRHSEEASARYNRNIIESHYIAHNSCHRNIKKEVVTPNGYF